MSTEKRPQAPHNGNLLKQALWEKRISSSELASRTNVSQSGMFYILKRKTLQTELLWKAGLALDRNFIAEIGDAFPVKFTTSREKELLAEQEKLIAEQNELKREIEKLNAQIEVYKQILKK